MPDLQAKAHLIRNTMDRDTIFEAIEKLNKKELIKLAKLLRISDKGHTSELRSRIIYCRRYI